MTETTFTTLGLAEPLLRALTAANYTTPTPIQAQSIPALNAGRDMIGLAQTGTGKTAAFALPMLQRLESVRQPLVRNCPRALILAPTRELALQIDQSVKALGRHVRARSTVVMGGVGFGNQAKAMAAGVDILIATPGRLLDLIESRHVRLDRVEYFVLDEADRMLDMGFIRDIKKIVALLPRERQSALFSATMPEAISSLASDLLKDPVHVSVTPAKVTVDRIEQHVYFVDAGNKRTLLTDMLAKPEMKRVIVFTRTKHGADKVAVHLVKSGIRAEAIHGNKSQGARQRALSQFKSGEARVLVATDIAARGIDVTEVTHVINFELPHEPESYVHRIGRTARAGHSGIALSFCAGDERPLLRDIERLTKTPMIVAMGERGTAGFGPRPPQQRNNGQRQGERQGDRGQPRNNNNRSQQRRQGAGGAPRRNRDARAA